MRRQHIHTRVVCSPCAARGRPWHRGAQGLAFLIILLAWSSARGETADIAIPKPAVAAAFQIALGSVQVHVDNHGPRRGTSWHEDHSFILLPYGTKRRFHVDELEVAITRGRRLKIYIQDLDTDAIRIAASGDRIVARLSFESQGEEVEVHCVRRLSGGWEECMLGIERDIHLDDTTIEISFVPVAHRGSISLSKPRVRFETELRIDNRRCRTSQGICGRIESQIRSVVARQIERALREALSSPRMRNAVADGVRDAAAFQAYVVPAWRVTRVTSRGGQLIVTVER